MKIKRIKLPLVATVTASVLAASLTVRASGQDVYFADGEQPTTFTSASSEVVEPTSLDVYPAAVAVLLARAAWAGFKSGVAAGAAAYAAKKLADWIDSDAPVGAELDDPDALFD